MFPSKISFEVAQPNYESPKVKNLHLSIMPFSWTIWIGTKIESRNNKDIAIKNIYITKQNKWQLKYRRMVALYVMFRKDKRCFFVPEWLAGTLPCVLMKAVLFHLLIGNRYLNALEARTCTLHHRGGIQIFGKLEAPLIYSVIL